MVFNVWLKKDRLDDFLIICYILGLNLAVGKNMEKIKTTKNKKSNVYLTWIILGMVVGILLECLLTVRAGCLGEWQERTILDLESMINEEKLELTDCTVEDGSILSEDANAMMIFHGTQDWGRYG